MLSRYIRNRVSLTKDMTPANLCKSLALHHELTNLVNRGHKDVKPHNPYARIECSSWNRIQRRFVGNRDPGVDEHHTRYPKAPLVVPHRSQICLAKPTTKFPLWSRTNPQHDAMPKLEEKAPSQVSLTHPSSGGIWSAEPHPQGNALESSEPFGELGSSYQPAQAPGYTGLRQELTPHQKQTVTTPPQSIKDNTKDKTPIRKAKTCSTDSTSPQRAQPFDDAKCLLKRSSF